MAFVPGWSPEIQSAAHARYAAQVGALPTLRARLKPKQLAKCLSRYRKAVLKQGQAGTCWVHSAVACVMTFAEARGYDCPNICRRLVAYVAGMLEGGRNATDGGDPLDALRAMTAQDGAGIAPEEMLPYSDSRRDLGTRPPRAVYDAAKKMHAIAPVRVRDLDEAISLIDEDSPVCVAIWWPYQWDHEGACFIDWIGDGVYGHALLIVGYMLPGVRDQHTWLHIENWHDLLYAVLPPEIAAQVEGYVPATPDRDSGFWVRRDVLEIVMAYGNSLLLAVTDVDGMARLFDPADAPSPGNFYA